MGVRVTGIARIAVLALLGLAVWTLLSMLWSPAPAAALADAEQAFLYAALLLLGICAGQVLDRQGLVALAPVGIAGAGVGVATAVALATGTDATSYLHGDATLAFPIGYRNANAAFFLICAWPLLAIATADRTNWAVRALAIGFSTMLIELAVLAQSRGSLPAAALALLVYLVMSPHRLRAAVGAGARRASGAARCSRPSSTCSSTGARTESQWISSTTPFGQSRSARLSPSALAAAVVFRGVYARLKPRAVGGCGWISRVAAADRRSSPLPSGGRPLRRAARGARFPTSHQRLAEFERERESRTCAVPGGALRRSTFGSGRNDYWRASLLTRVADHPLVGARARARSRSPTSVTAAAPGDSPVTRTAWRC